MNFPDLHAPVIPFTPIDAGDVTAPSYRGRSVLLSNLDFPLYRANVVYPKLNWESYVDLQEFFYDRKAGARPFTFQCPIGHDAADLALGRIPEWRRLYVGVGDGVTAIFDLPLKSFSGVWGTDLLLSVGGAVVDTANCGILTNRIALPNDFTLWAANPTGPGGGSSDQDQADPDGGTSASRLEFSGAGPQGLYLDPPGTILKGDDVEWDIWLKSPITSPLDVTLQSGLVAGEKTELVVPVTDQWQKFRAPWHTATVDGSPRIGFQMATTTDTIHVYLARIAPGRDGRAQASFDAGFEPGLGDEILVKKGRFQRTIHARFTKHELARPTGTAYVVYNPSVEVAEMRLDV